ncbi:MAG TPA: hypothetical protein VNA15_01855 [Candidatus Angelobacter sp.]|nr:hypothetical protein [Candidatus Angelobacter sp.]
MRTFPSHSQFTVATDSPVNGQLLFEDDDRGEPEIDGRLKLRATIIILMIIAILGPIGMTGRLAHTTSTLPARTAPASVPSPCDSSKTVLLIQDITPWSGRTNHDPKGADVNELNRQNESFCLITSSQIGTVNLAQFLEVIIPSAQSQSYYDNLFPEGTFSPSITSWVGNGGVLSANLADCASAPGAGGGWSFAPCSLTASSYTFVGGVKNVGSFSDENTISDSSHPVITGQFGQRNGGQIVDVSDLKDLDGWRSSSHSYFTNLPSGTTIILSEPSGPVFIEYRYGDGLVVATTTSIEFRYDYFQLQYQNLKLLANEIGYQNFKAVCQEKDGDGDFNGNHGHGHFHFDKDNCEDGNQDQVSSSDRGDGKDFQSTQIQSTQLDTVNGPRTLTITGLGTSGGLPVAFTFVAVEPGLTTPGLASFVFSDGFSNAGPVTSGSVLLHGW